LTVFEKGFLRTTSFCQLWDSPPLGKINVLLLLDSALAILFCTMGLD